MLGRLFSVMHKREDLPEMRLPLALLCMLLTALSSCMGAYLLSSALSGEVGFGVIAVLPLISLSVCLYSMTILLWRRVQSLLTTPITALLMYHLGVGAFASVVLLVTVIVCSYAHAVSMLSRETKFRRIGSTSLLLAICAFLSCIAFVSMYSSPSECVITAYRYITSALREYLLSLGVGVTEYECASVVRELMLLIPAYIGIISIGAVALCDVLISRLFVFLDCEGWFIVGCRDTSMPKAYAMLYIASFLLFGSFGSDSLFHAVFKSATYIMLFPCAYVGLSLIFSSGDVSELSRRRIFGTVAVVSSLAIFGLGNTLALISLYGAVKVAVQRQIKQK